MHGDIDADSSIRGHQSDRVDSATTVERETGDQAHLQNAHRKRLVVLAAVVGVTLIGALTTISLTGGDREREVAERGRRVMPFDLEATTHHFEPTADGLIETVTADEPSDQKQIALIRSHLELEAQRFRSGDYSDPARIHGDDMPGLEPLTGSWSTVSISYEEVAAGARIVFRSDDRSTVDALHAWAKAQVSDHGRHSD